MSHAAFLMGCAGVSLAIVILLAALSGSQPTTWPALKWTVAITLVAAWSLGFGANAAWGVDYLRPIVSAWAILGGVHHLHYRGRYV